MTTSTGNSKPPRSHYSIHRDKDGVDETYDIACNLTGNTIASLPFWEQDAETLSDARILVRALNRLHRRGYCFMERFANSFEAIERKYYSPIIGGDDENA